MIRRVLFFLIGVGLAVWLLGRVRATLRKAHPSALGERLSGSAAGVGDQARDFTDRVRAAMAERETELRDALGLHE